MSDLNEEMKRLENESRATVKDVRESFSDCMKNARKVAAKALNFGVAAEIINPDPPIELDEEAIEEAERESASNSFKELKKDLRARDEKLEEPTLNFGGSSQGLGAAIAAGAPYLVSKCDPDTMNEIKKEVAEESSPDTCEDLVRKGLAREVLPENRLSDRELPGPSRIITGSDTESGLVEGPPDPVYRAKSSRAYYPAEVGPIIESLIDKLGIIELDSRYGSQARTDAISQGYKDQVDKLEKLLISENLKFIDRGSELEGYKTIIKAREKLLEEVIEIFASSPHKLIEDIESKLRDDKAKVDELEITLNGSQENKKVFEDWNKQNKAKADELEKKLEEVENELAGSDELRIGSRQDTLAANKVIAIIASEIGFDLEGRDRMELPQVVGIRIGELKQIKTTLECARADNETNEKRIASLGKECETYKQVAEQARADSKRPRVTKVFKPGDEENVLLVEKNNKLERDLNRLQESIEDLREEMSLADTMSLDAVLEIVKTEVRENRKGGSSDDTKI